VWASGRGVWTVYADNEGHGFAKQANGDYLGAVEAMFLREHLVPCHPTIFGYKRLSLIRALAVVNCQSTAAWRVLRSCDHACD
jgi:hypothetical protein